ncbi:MAG: hypothetical protein ACNS62_09730 [Candidatus Cyclobacteriaceae bacterium M3_2C_046]
MMNYFVALLVFNGWLLSAHFNDDDCKVLIPEISGTYEGDCRRGLAHGDGKSQGTDSYEGEFKKGLPDGYGKYTWSDGHYYEGEWKKGEKEGEGKLVYMRTGKEDSVVTGFWEEDKYTGQYEDPYKILSKSTEIQRVVVRKLAATPKEINVRFNRGTQRLILEGGNPANQTGSGWINIDFPFKGLVETQVSTTQGTGVGTRTVKMEFEIYEEGQWEIQVAINPDI